MKNEGLVKMYDEINVVIARKFRIVKYDFK